MECENNFMLRVPYNSFDYYKNNLERNSNCTINGFKENLLISSPVLYKALLNKKELTEDENMSLNKYLIRSSTRCTPYGLTSGVLYGSFKDNNDLNIEKEFVKKVRPDMLWLVHVIKLLETELGTKLKLIINNMNEFKGNKILKKWNGCFLFKNDNNNERTIYINNTNAVKYLFKICENYVSIEEIIKKLKINSSNVNEIAITNFVKNLLDNEFLTSDLRPNSLVTDPLGFILNKMEEYNHSSKLVNELKKLSLLLIEYEQVRVGYGEEKYNNIIDLMKSIHEENNYLQVDMLNNSEISLSNDVRNEINDFASFISKYRYNETYYDYAMRFKEKYGNQAVKYLDLIDADIGIGVPTSDDKNSLKYNDHLICKILALLSNNKDDEIKLDEYFKDDEVLVEKNIPQTAGELALYLLEEDNKRKYILSPLMGSNTENKISGRFGYLFPKMKLPESNKVIKEIEVCFIPKNGRHCNVMMCKSNKKAYLEYGTSINIKDKEKVELDDIYVIVDNNNYIRFVQKSTNEIVEFYASNMFNISAYPKELQILIELTNKQKMIFTSFYTALQHYVMQIKGFMPRITYKNFTLFPASYSLNCDIDYKDKQSDMKKIYNYIKEMQKSKKFSPLISVGPLDQRMLLNVDNKMHLKILYDLLKKDNRIRIFENVFDINNLVVSDMNKNKYVGELVVSLSNKKNDNSKKLMLPSNIQYLDNEVYLNHSKMPFESWMSIKLYANDEMHNYILTKYVSLINRRIKKEFDNTDMFYIRYKDPKSHIRLRIRYQEKDLENIINIISNAIHELKTQHLITNCIIDTYFQEFERYGGDSIYDYAEKLFCFNSDMALELIKIKDFKLTNLSLVDLFILTTYKSLEDLGISGDEKLYYLDNFNIGKKYNSEFKTIKERLKGYLDKNNFWENLRSSEEGIRLLIQLDKYENEFKKFWDRVDYHFGNNIERKKGILLSLFHMQFNRMIGINRGLENKIMGYLRKLIYIQAMKVKYYEKK